MQYGTCTPVRKWLFPKLEHIHFGVLLIIVPIGSVKFDIDQVKNKQTHTWKCDPNRSEGNGNGARNMESSGRFSKCVIGSNEEGGGIFGKGERRLMRGIRVGDAGQEGIDTVGSLMVWKAGGGVGADAARRPCPF